MLTDNFEWHNLKNVKKGPYELKIWDFLVPNIGTKANTKDLITKMSSAHVEGV